MGDLIQIHKTEVLNILRHVIEVRTEIGYAFECLDEKKYKQLDGQLRNMRVHLDEILRYFEQEFHIGIKQKLK